MKKTLSAVLSALIVLLSAGLAPYEAAAAEFASSPAASAPKLSAAVSVTLPAPSLPQAVPGLTLPTVSAVLPGVSIQAPAAASAKAAPSARAALQVGARAAAVSRTMQVFGKAQNPSSESAARAGAAVEGIITGERASDDADEIRASVSSDLGLSFAKPAGAEIRESAEAFHHDAAPQPPAPPQTPSGEGGNGGGDGPNGAPLPAKIVSSLVALAPAAVFGLRLIVGGAPIVGALVVLASLGVAASPFMSARTPRLARSLPGLAIAAGGVLLTGFGIAVAPVGLRVSALVVPGILTTLGGWGLVRFARNDSKWKSMEPSELILTYIGALAAVSGIGLGFSLLVGPLATVGMVAASIGAVPLLTQLPGWVGSAIERSVYGVYLSVREAYRVATSVRRDTTLYKRLAALSEAYVEKSVWNLTWLGLFVWLPLVAVEAASTIIGVSFGLAHGLIRAPIMAAWGSSYAWKKDSRLTKVLGAMGRRLFAYNKALTFNNAEKRLLPWANSSNPAKNAAAALGIRAMQLVWLSLGTLALAAYELVGWEQASADSKLSHDANLDDPGYVKTPADDLPSKVPEVSKPNVANPVSARVLAAAIGLVPLVLLAAPVMTGGGIFGAMIAGASLLIALMPLIPAKHGGAASMAGTLLAASGLFTAAAAARFLVMGLPVGAIVGMGVAAFLGGIGLRQLVKKLRKNEDQTYDTDSPLYALGFVGALAVSAGLDASLLGKGGLLANSLFAVGGLGGLTLSFFLPKYLWQGLGETVKGAGYSISSVYKALSFWHEKTDFSRNLTTYLNGLVRRWWAAGALLVAIPYAALGAVRLIEAATSLAVGLTVAFYQAPARYLWGAAYHANPNSRLTRFLAGFNRTVLPGLEGKGAMYGEVMARFFGKALSVKAPSGRPSLKAWLALAPMMALTSFWLGSLALNLAPLYWAGVGLGLLSAHALGLPLWLISSVMGGSLLLVGIMGGVRNARGLKEAKPSYQDPDNPDFTWSRREVK